MFKHKNGIFGTMKHKCKNTLCANAKKKKESRKQLVCVCVCFKANHKTLSFFLLRFYGLTDVSWEHLCSVSLISLDIGLANRKCLTLHLNWNKNTLCSHECSFCLYAN